MGIEPMTSSLPRKRSTPELHRLMPREYMTLSIKVGRAGFEPTKAEPTDLQSAPFDRFGTFPILFLDISIKFIRTRADGGIRTHDLLITNQLL